MAMLKLTDGALGATDGAVYLMTKHIVGMYRMGTYTHVQMTYGAFMITETPEEIMAMEAMVKEMNPIVYVPPVTIPDFLERR